MSLTLYIFCGTFPQSMFTIKVMYLSEVKVFRVWSDASWCKSHESRQVNRRLNASQQRAWPTGSLLCLIREVLSTKSWHAIWRNLSCDKKLIREKKIMLCALYLHFPLCQNNYFGKRDIPHLFILAIHGESFRDARSVHFSVSKI